LSQVGWEVQLIVRMDDSGLIRRAVENARAFEMLYRRHAARLYRTLARETNPEIALDLVAETFARVLVSAGRYRGETDAEAAAWLNGISRNLVREFIRRERIDTRARRKLEIEQAVALALAACETPDGDFVDLAHAVDQAFTDLDADTQHALRLRVVEERSYDEVAQLLEIQPAAARMRVSRGLKALGTKLRGATE
jgi:RNA polymerase sigma factor (sigma-70 family)